MIIPDVHAANRQRAYASARLVLRGIFLNLVLAVVKFAGGILGHTYAVIADGVESLLDVFSSILVWAGCHVAGRPPDEDHPYGHGKAEAIAALAASMPLVAASPQDAGFFTSSLFSSPRMMSQGKGE